MPFIYPTAAKLSTSIISFVKKKKRQKNSQTKLKSNQIYLALSTHVFLMISRAESKIISNLDSLSTAILSIISQ